MLCARCQVHTGPVLETSFCCYTTKLGKFSLRNGIAPHSRTWVCVCVTTLFSIHLGVCVSPPCAPRSPGCVCVTTLCPPFPWVCVCHHPVPPVPLGVCVSPPCAPRSPGCVCVTTLCPPFPWVCVCHHPVPPVPLGVCVSHSPCGDVRQSCDIGTQFPSPLSQWDQLIWDIVVHCCHGMALECLWNVLMMFVDPASSLHS